LGLLITNLATSNEPTSLKPFKSMLIEQGYFRVVYVKTLLPGFLKVRQLSPNVGVTLRSKNGEKADQQVVFSGAVSDHAKSKTPRLVLLIVQVVDLCDICFT
jgi:hypothetical protein